MKAVAKETDDLINGWREQLSLDETIAWIQAHREDLQKSREVAEVKLEFLEDVLSVTKGFKTLDEALAAIKAKSKRTVKEDRVLDAFEGMMNEPAGGCKTDCVIAGSPTDLENTWRLKRK